ncbi:glucose-fructose oxidoreductase domain-containing protein 1 [Phlebotomus argentipes]|uniref:glucose-fructose oxidoreductase domain-containing protein 1 n=1 Tax=Phlebotomus argentipes TaxID=94469 RepID=UPI0028937C46|nr:glucose-fructose oxidoreductase domain-containing protein 1 [Phlebotomus argentipes]
MLPGVGIFGTGNVTRVLVPLLREKGFHIEAIWGRTSREAEEAAQELQIPFHTSKIDDVLLRKSVHLVFIVCQPLLHSEISVKTLGIGKHLVCGSSGLGQTDALKMFRASQYYPTLIALVNHSLRFLPAFTHMRKAIQESYVGESVSLIDIRVQMGSLLREKFDWICDATMGGGVLNLIGSHVIDVISFLTGRRATRVHGVVRTFTKTTSFVNGIRQVSAPDFCTFQMELDGGILVTATLQSHVSNNTFSQEIIVCGSEGHLTVRGGDLFGQRVSSKSDKEEVLFVDVQDLHCRTSDTLLPRPYIKGLCKMVGALREAFLPVQEQTGWIKEPVQMAATFDDGLYVQAVLDAIQRSSEQRSWIKVSIMTESPTNQTKLLNAARLSAVTLH